MTEKTLDQRRAAFRLLDFLETHGDKHNQANWVDVSPESPLFDRYWEGELHVVADEMVSSCGTTACAAGWTVLLAGHAVNGARVRMSGGQTMAVPTLAGRILGLDSVDRFDLFWESNDLSDVRKVIEQVHGPRPDGV